ncbi:MAG TPA: extracellular solute-binding protein [Stellaceae bacterium]|nr:extracellular solute-binding protein [Stellaceae bacterium]
MQQQAVSRRTILGGIGATAIIGAAGAQSAASDWQAGAPPEWATVLAKARAEGQVTVAAFAALAEPMAAAFKRDTGIELNFLGGGTSQQSARLEAEARAKNLTIDILIGGGRELRPMMRDGMLEPVAPQLMLPGVAPKNFREGKLKWMDNSSQFLLQGAEYVFGWLLVNKDMVDPAAIKSWRDLLDPKYHGKIASDDLRTPGPGQGSSAWIYNVFGIDYIKALFVDQAVTFTSDNRLLVENVARGITPIVFGAIQAQVERFRHEGFTNLAVVLPEDAPGYLTGGFSVLKEAKGVPHPNAATVFINWYMSRPGQEMYEAVMLETSRRTDIHTGLPDYLVPRDGVKYYEAYNEEVYFSRDAVVKLVSEALGNR